MAHIYVRLPNNARITIGVGNELYLSNRALRSVYHHTLRGNYRIEDTSLIRYELYQGIDAQPDFTAAAWQTFNALPFTTPVLAVGHTYNFVLRKRNQHNLVSQNVQAWQLILDSGGSSALYPSAPISQSMAQAAGGAGLITATYDALKDLANVAADTWAVWLTSDGSTPNTSSAATYTTPMIISDGQPKLSYLTAGFAQGTVLKAIVRARRSGAPTYDSQNSTVLQITADAIGPVAPAGAGVFFGESADQAPAGIPPGVGAGAFIRARPRSDPLPPAQRPRATRRPKYP